MENYYNLDGIKTHLRKELANAEALTKAWAAVTFPTKKDGKPFANMGKNIEGASYKTEAWNEKYHPERKTLTVCTFSPSSGYIHDTLCCWGWRGERNEIEYTFDLDEIKKAVADKVESFTKRAESLRKQIDDAEQVFTELRKLYADFRSRAEEIQKGYDTPTLYYAVLGTIEKNYPYI